MLAIESVRTCEIFTTKQRRAHNSGPAIRMVMEFKKKKKNNKRPKQFPRSRTRVASPLDNVWRSLERSRSTSLSSPAAVIWGPADSASNFGGPAYGVGAGGRAFSTLLEGGGACVPGGGAGFRLLRVGGASDGTSMLPYTGSGPEAEGWGYEQRE
jgi:hypothetical protein